jgi:hypothetical protein
MAGTRRTRDCEEPRERRHHPWAERADLRLQRTFIRAVRQASPEAGTVEMQPTKASMPQPSIVFAEEIR